MGEGGLPVDNNKKIKIKNKKPNIEHFLTKPPDTLTSSCKTSSHYPQFNFKSNGIGMSYPSLKKKFI